MKGYKRQQNAMSLGWLGAEEAEADIAIQFDEI
jgi:hypothetical protein